MKQSCTVSISSFKNYLHKQPLVDWLDRWGANWLYQETTPEHVRSLMTDARVRAQCTVYKSAATQSPTDTRSSSFTVFYQWLLTECTVRKLKPPIVGDFSQAAAVSVRTALSESHAQIHTIYESVHLSSTRDHIQIRPTALVSGVLADKLFTPYKPDDCNDVPFASWVVVFLKAGASKDTKGGYVKNTYDELRCHVAQRALDEVNSTDEDPHHHFISAVVLNLNHPCRSKFWMKRAKTEPVLSICTDAKNWSLDVEHPSAALWDPLHPHRVEMCAPVGSRVPGRWQAIVDYLLYATDDICCIHQIGHELREQAWALGARNYHDLWTMQNTLASLKLTPLMLEMSWANHSQNPQKTVNPRHLRKPKHRALIERTKKKPWFVVDFETLNIKKQPWIFMVATAFVDPSTTPATVKVFTHHMDVLTIDSQVQMLIHWVNGMLACIDDTYTSEDLPRSEDKSIELLTNIPILHWSSAEPSFLKRSLSKSSVISSKLHETHSGIHSLLTTVAKKKQAGGLCWCDVYTIFCKEPITISGCFDFKLKHVVKALVALDKISPKHVWEASGPQDGRAAMQLAEYGYVSNDASVFNDIRKYNEADVLVLYEIMVNVLWKMI